MKHALIGVFKGNVPVDWPVLGGVRDEQGATNIFWSLTESCFFPLLFWAMLSIVPCPSGPSLTEWLTKCGTLKHQVAPLPRQTNMPRNPASQGVCWRFRPCQVRHYIVRQPFHSSIQKFLESTTLQTPAQTLPASLPTKFLVPFQPQRLVQRSIATFHNISPSRTRVSPSSLC